MNNSNPSPYHQNPQITLAPAPTPAPAPPTPSAQASVTVNSGGSVSVSSTKFLDLARKIKEIEMENAKLSVKLDKSNQHLFRLKLERSILMEKLVSVEPRMKKSVDSVSDSKLNIKNEILKQIEDLDEEIN